MSLGRSIARRCTAPVIANPASTCREPLLFLYPKWIRNSSTSQAQALVQSTHEPIPPVEYSTTDNPIPPQSVQPGNRSSNSSSSHGTDSRPHISPVNTNDTRVDEALQNGNGSSQLVSRSKLGHIKRAPSGTSKATGNSPIGKKVRSILESHKGSNISKELSRYKRHVYHEDRREARSLWIPDWRVILADLLKYTPTNERWLNKALKISLREGEVGQLLLGVDENIWDIASRHGCSVEFDMAEDAKVGRRNFLVSGPELQIRKTVLDVLRVAPQAEVIATAKKLLSEDSSGVKMTIATSMADEPQGRKVRRVMAENRKSLILRTRIDEIPRPVEWSITSFTEYVRYITSVEVPNHLHMLMYKGHKDHIITVTELLHDVFADPQCKSSISRTAFNAAMTYFVKHNRIEDARVLFVRMDMINLEMDPETFNIMLRGAAKAEDLQNFQFILHLMIRKGFSPNGPTWIAFVMANSDLRIQRYVISAMKKKGLLSNTSTLKSACEHTVSAEILFSMSQNQSQEEFLRHMDSRYGQDWMSIDSANRILDALGRSGLASRCRDFIFVMESRFIKPDNVSLNTILNHCKQPNSIDGAIHVLGSLPTNVKALRDDHTYDILFEIAWSRRSYNVARVVWRYACLSAATTRKMRRVVHEGLEISTSNWRIDVPSRSSNVISSLIVSGFNHSQNHPMKLLERELRSVRCLEEDEAAPEGVYSQSVRPNSALPIKSEPVLRISPSAGAGPKKRELSKALQLLDLDNTVFRDWSPVIPFEDMLVKALERDKEWASLGILAKWEERDWMLANALPVPIQNIGRGEVTNWK